MPDNGVALTVRLMVYSGQLDPVWELTNSEARPLLDALSHGVTEGGLVAAPSDPGLGYRGFLVTPKDRMDQLGDQILVYRRVIARTDRRKSDWFVDVGGAEEFLLRLARERGQGQVLAALGVEIPGE
jgi:hypothetical protein